jgi:hypothetical protein
MPSLVEDLQRNALDHNIPVTALLQKCLVVAVKLNLDEFAEWARLELDGYGENDVPDYRILHGATQVFNPYRGYQPLDFGDLEQKERFSKMYFNTPIGELEHDLKNAEKSGSDNFHVTFSPSVEKALMDAIDYGLRPSLNINVSQFRGIMDAVRKAILEWSLKLETDGITGEGMSFSPEEKERAQGDTYNIKNYIHGDISDSQIQIEAMSSTQIKTIEFDIEQIKNLVTALESTVDALGLDDNGKQELKSDIATLEAQSASSNPKNSIIGESISSIRTILEGAAGNLVASGMLSQIGKLFGI